MKSQIILALARALKLKPEQIISWEIQACCRGQVQDVLGSSQPFVLEGLVIPSLSVKFLDTHTWIQDEYTRCHLPELPGMAIETMNMRGGVCTAQVALFHSPQTAHLFKALYQTIAFKRPKKRKPK